MKNLSLKDQYVFLRKRIEHGDNLVNHRLGWWLASQGALYTAFFSVWHATEQHRILVLLLLAVVGVLVSIFTIMSVTGHFKNVKMFRLFWNAQAGVTDREGLTIKDFPHLAYEGKWWNSGAEIAAIGMPVAAIMLWILLACVA